MKIQTLAATQKGDPRILACAYDAQNYAFAEGYCNFYLELISADRRNLESVSKFHIQNLIEEMDNILTRKERENLEKFWGLKGGPKHYLKLIRPNDVASVQMIENAVSASDALNSFASLYKWQDETNLAIDNIATKVYDPANKYTNVEKAKVAHCYYRYISSMLLMAYDYKKNGDVLLTSEEKETENKVFAVPDLLSEEWDCFFCKLADEDIIPEMVMAFLNVIPEDCKTFVEKDCQISENKYHRTSLGEVRELKERIFYTGNWYNGTFCTFSEIKKIPLKNFTDLISVANASNDSWKGIHSRKRTVLFPAQGTKSVTIEEFVSKRTFASKFEYAMFKEAVKFLEKTNFIFHKKLFKDYEFSKELNY